MPRILSPSFWFSFPWLPPAPARRHERRGEDDPGADERGAQEEELPPLKPSALLFKVAQAHSENMAKQGKMEHDLDGKTPFQRLQAAGNKYSRAHENIAKGDAEVPAGRSHERLDGIQGPPREYPEQRQCTEIGLGIGQGQRRAGLLHAVVRQTRSIRRLRLSTRSGAASGIVNPLPTPPLRGPPSSSAACPAAAAPTGERHGPIGMPSSCSAALTPPGAVPSVRLRRTGLSRSWAALDAAWSPRMNAS